MPEISFKERVKNIAIEESKHYKDIFTNYEYLICSEAFKLNSYYIIAAKEDNYQHLIGINSLISPQKFFDKCYNSTLTENDFNFNKRGKSEKSVIGSVRRKINVLPNIKNLFFNNLKVEETFEKNSIVCNFATTDNKCTLGFITASESYPMTLIKGNALNINNEKNVDLILRKEINNEKFDEIIIGDYDILKKYYNKINHQISIVLEEVAATLN